MTSVHIFFLFARDHSRFFQAAHNSSSHDLHGRFRTWELLLSHPDTQEHIPLSPPSPTSQRKLFFKNTHLIRSGLPRIIPFCHKTWQDHCSDILFTGYTHTKEREFYSAFTLESETLGTVSEFCLPQPDFALLKKKKRHWNDLIFEG